MRQPPRFLQLSERFQEADAPYNSETAVETASCQTKSELRGTEENNLILIAIYSTRVGGFCLY
ncbi:hypothetical protein, partial [Microcoleus sp. herbarium12]|uniref:hypothetical protein n=1 Tax=Microcoleus sp. herbarium12 TaxID=3055437 RepID=UPI002FD2E00D